MDAGLKGLESASPETLAVVKRMYTGQ
jgi:hypothetical protein